MVSQQFRALAVGLLLTTASVAGGSLAMTTTAEAAARPQVGKLLQQAIDLAKSGSTSAASSKVQQAEAVGGLTPGDQQAIAQVKSFIAAKSGSGATGSKAKFAADYNAGRYAQVVGPDAEELRKAGQYDAQAQLIVAQAYYLMGNYQQAIKLLSGLSGETAQGLLMSAAHKSGDTVAEQKAAEHLILGGQPKYWTYMLAGADAKGWMPCPPIPKRSVSISPPAPPARNRSAGARTRSRPSSGVSRRWSGPLRNAAWPLTGATGTSSPFSPASATATPPRRARRRRSCPRIFWPCWKPAIGAPCGACGTGPCC